MVPLNNADIAFLGGEGVSSSGNANAAATSVATAKFCYLVNRY
jgi:hypothetical protein